MVPVGVLLAVKEGLSELPALPPSVPFGRLADLRTSLNTARGGPPGLLLAPAGESADVSAAGFIVLIKPGDARNRDGEGSRCPESRGS